MIEYQETSRSDPGRRHLLILAWLLWLAWTIFELDQWYRGRPSLLGIGYIPFFAFLIVWRTAFRYVLSVEGGNLTVSTLGLGTRRTLVIPLSSIVRHSSRYNKKDFKLFEIDAFSHRYSAMDGNPRRVFVYKEPNRKKPKAVIFKSTEKFQKLLDGFLSENK